MAFREDFDALLARAEALERENKQLRQKIAERDDLDDVEDENKKLSQELTELREHIAEQEKKQAKLDKKERAKKKAAKRTARKLRRDNRKLGSMLGDTKDDRREVFIQIAVFAAVVVGIGAYGIYTCTRPWTVSYKHHQIMNVWLVDGEHGEPLAALYFSREKTRSKGSKRSAVTQYALATVDLAKGTSRGTWMIRRRKNKRSRGSYEIYPPGDHLAWAWHPTQGLQVLDLRKPAPVLGRAQLQSTLGAPSSYRLSGARGDVATIVLADGSKRYVDTTGKLHETPPPNGLPATPGFECPNHRGYRRLCARKRCAGFTRVEGSTAWRLAYQAPGRWVRDPKPASADAAPLIHPFLLWHARTKQCAFEHDGNVLIAHDSTAVGKSKGLVSLVDAAGKIVWTRHLPLQMYSLIGATFHDGWIYVLSKGKRGTYARLSLDGRQFSVHPLVPTPKP